MWDGAGRRLRDALHTSGDEAGRIGLLKTSGAQKIILCNSDARHRASGFGICPAGFGFVLVLLSYALILFFWEKYVFLYHSKSEVYTLWLGSQSV